MRCVYQAFDGTLFDDHHEAEAYEATMRLEELAAKSGDIHRYVEPMRVVSWLLDNRDAVIKELARIRDNEVRK